MFLICSISDSPGRRTTMADALMFYTNPMSRGQIVRWMLEEVGAPYEPRLLDYGTTMKAGDYLAINPMGKVPAIVHDGKAVTECAAICAYLAYAFPEAGLAPAPADRADHHPGQADVAVAIPTSGMLGLGGARGDCHGIPVRPAQRRRAGSTQRGL